MIDYEKLDSTTLIVAVHKRSYDDHINIGDKVYATMYIKGTGFILKNSGSFLLGYVIDSTYKFLFIKLSKEIPTYCNQIDWIILEEVYREKYND